MPDTEAPYVKTARKNSGKKVLYNLIWNSVADPIAVELSMIKHGGQWTQKNGELAGEGLFFHMRRFQELVWPDKIWRKGPFVNYWAEKILETWIEAKYFGIMGCAASSKSDSLASIVLSDWYAFPDCTTTLVTSTDLKSLERRIWGYVKGYHRRAKSMRDWIPGHLIEGKQMIIQDPRHEFEEGREFKNGIMGVACLKGNQFVGLGPLVGVHNKRVRLVADESNLCPRAYLDATSNLSKCPDFKMAALGNPNETTNAHGIICEPSAELGGWEGGIDQTPGTKTWKTRFPDGICLQLPGSDSPNMKAGDDEEVPFPFLITRQQLKDDAQVWGIDDWHYAMFDDAKMPRGQGSRRVITRQECEKFGATLAPIWRDSNITKIGSLDAAYRATGGDRCVFTEINFGRETESNAGLIAVDSVISQNTNVPQGRQILALVDQVIVPIEASISADLPEHQIVRFCRKQCENRGIKPENFFYDAGMRTSLVTAFTMEWTPEVQSVDFGGKPSEQKVSTEINIPCHEYYQKFVTELWYSVRYIIISRQFRGMTKDVMWELSAREWTHAPGSNKIQVESKADMKLKSSRSPDLADSLVTACYGARMRGFVIGKLQPIKPPNRGRDWRDDLRAKEKKIWQSGILEYATVSGNS